MRYISRIILLVLCMTLLLITGCVANAVIYETTSRNLENQENTEEPVIVDTEGSGTVYSQKWSGLGMCLGGVDDINQFNTDVDTLLANGFTQIRVHLSPYTESGWQTLSKAAVLSAISKGADVIWGVTGGAGPLTADDWVDYRVEILAAAQWAQDNGVYEFQIGNEEEMHNDDTTLTDTQLIANLKSVATEVQAIFTNGNVSYSFGGVGINTWLTTGKGDIDILATNLYMGGHGYYDDWWKTLITKMVNAFGTDGIYLTEFGPSWSSLNDYSTDEAVQAKAISEMINYIISSSSFPN